jgi:hypothetical protein
MCLPPSAWSSQRHWHAKEDEFIYVLSGEVVLATDAGEEVLRAGDCAGFKAGDPDGHCLQNRLTAVIAGNITGQFVHAAATPSRAVLLMCDNVLYLTSSPNTEPS